MKNWQRGIDSPSRFPYRGATGSFALWRISAGSDAIDALSFPGRSKRIQNPCGSLVRYPLLGITILVTFYVIHSENAPKQSGQCRGKSTVLKPGPLPNAKGKSAHFWMKCLS
jgi:hypothetical protein